MTTPRLSAALVTLRAEVEAAHPGRSHVSDGWLGDAAHAHRVSDHNPDAAGIVHAIDVTVWDGPDPDTADDVAAPLAAFLLARRDPRTKYVIHRGQMFASYATAHRPAWTWGPYTGPNGHFHHVHVSVYGDDGDDGAAWHYPPQPAHEPAEDDMTPEQDKMLREVHAQLCTSRDDTSPAGPTIAWKLSKILGRTADLVTGRRPVK